MAQPGLDLHAFGAVVVVDMFQLVPNEESELVLTGHQAEQTFPDIDVAARKGEGIDHGAILYKMKRIGKAPMRVQCNRVADAADVTFQRLIFWTYFGVSNRVLPGELVADRDLFVIGKMCEPHGHSTQVTLGIGRDCHNRVGRNGCGLAPALALVKRRNPNREHGKKCGHAFHKPCFIGIAEWHRDICYTRTTPAIMLRLE